MAPLFLGGRHDLGRLIFVLLASVAGVAWFAHQAISPENKWTRTWAFPIGLASLLLVALQLLPLSRDWLTTLSPRIATLLPLWADNGSSSAALGTWATLSLAPSATSVALATLIAYVLLFATTVGRLRSKADIEHLIRLIGIAGVLMSCFGLIQYFFSNDRFFWFYEHPYTTTSDAVKGSFTTRNHFAHFLTLAIGPLLACCLLVRSQPTSAAKRSTRKSPPTAGTRPQMLLILYCGLVVVTLGVLLSLSRGGAAAFATAVTFAVAAYYRRGLVNGNSLFGLAMLGAIVVGLLSFTGYEQVSDRLDDFVAGSVEGLDKNEGRRKIWAANLDAIQAGTFFGAGAGSHREIYHLYLPESLTREYSHAENGYLQIATENGWVGIFLLSAALIAIGWWCVTALMRSSTDYAFLLAVGITASLLASVVHSVVDFVWFIPSCMSLTIILAACALRLSQLEARSHSTARCSVIWPRPRWIGMTAAAAAVAGWAIATTWGPATAATHHDKYLIAAKLNREQSFRRLTANSDLAEATDDVRANTESAIFHLRNTLAHNPRSARAHLRLAGKYLNYFHLLQQSAANSMSADQI
ncbi:MAG: O-antigen ligase family protein, partial [Bythopirellula sp.]